MKTHSPTKYLGPLVAILGLAFLSHPEARAAIVDLNFGDAGTAIDNGPQDGVFDGFAPYNFGSVNNNGYTSFRTALEFDISAIPRGAKINAATLTMSVGWVDGIRSIALNGYAGDGAVQLADFSRDLPVDLTILYPIAGTPVVFDATAFIQSLVNAGEGIAGFNVREEPANALNFLVLFFEMNGAGAPHLTIDFIPAPPDADGDGVPDDQDQCSNTPPGAIVDSHGCSIDQLVPCAGPLSGGVWRNHGEYVSAVAKTAGRFQAEGRITEKQKDAIVQAAARSNCGKKQ